MKDLNNYQFSKLKKSENYKSWKINIISTLKVKDLWWIILRKLKKSIISNSEFKTAVKKKYVSTILNWKNKNNRVCDVIIFSIEQKLRIHIVKIKDIIKMWSILKTQYEQSNLIILYLMIKELTQSKQLNFNFIQNYADSLKQAVIKCSNIDNAVTLWMLSNLFLLDLNESLELYIFDLIHKIVKIQWASSASEFLQSQEVMSFIRIFKDIELHAMMSSHLNLITLREISKMSLTLIKDVLDHNLHDDKDRFYNISIQKNNHNTRITNFEKEHYKQDRVNLKDDETMMNCTNCSNADSKMIASDVDLSQENKDAKLKHLRNDEENVANIIDLLIKISTLEKEKNKDYSWKEIALKLIQRLQLNSEEKHHANQNAFIAKNVQKLKISVQLLNKQLHTQKSTRLSMKITS